MQTQPSPESDKQRISEALKASLPPDVTKALSSGHRPGRPLKPSFRHVIEFDWNRTFSWKERLQILLGYSFNVMIRIPTLHKPGELGVLVIGETSVFENAKDLLRARVHVAMLEQYGSQLDQVTWEKDQKGRDRE